MEKQHRDAIRRNFSSLVERTDLDLMVAVLYEKGVFSEQMTEPYKDSNKDVRTRKRQLYRDITRRGPEAFRHLLDTLMENGYWDIVRELDPSSTVLPMPIGTRQAEHNENRFLSLFETKRPGKEQNEKTKPRDPDRSDRPSHSRDIENGDVGPDKLEPEDGGAPPDQVRVPPFKVIKSTKFFEDTGNDIKLYRSRGRVRGVLVLFTYIDFKNDIEETRIGAQTDADNLKYLFGEFGFKLRAFSNLTKKETQEKLINLRHGISPEVPDTVFIVFSSHGYNRGGTGDTDIRCSDGGLISYYDIFEYFTNEKFPELYGIPKVFIFQSCRGRNNDYLVIRAPTLRKPDSRGLRPRRGPAGAAAGAVTSHDGSSYLSHEGEDEDADTDAHNNDTYDRVYSDMLIASSTVPGYVSNRDLEDGSWYIQALCDVFAARAHDCHVEKLFTLVDQQLHQRFSTQTSSIDRWGFNKRLYLHPGLYEE